MKYFKLVNCHVRGLFPVKKGDINSGPIDWVKAGFNPSEITREQVNGFDSVEMDNYVTLYPIADEAKLTASGIVVKVNENDNEEDSASIISEIEADEIKAVLLSVRESQSGVA